MPGQVEVDIVVPKVSSLAVSLEPAHNALYSMKLLLHAETLSGLGDWVVSTHAALTPEERETLDLVIIGFHYAILPEISWPSFPAYVEHLATRDPVALRDRMLNTYARIPPRDARECWTIEDEPLPVDWEAVLADVDAYLGFLSERFDAAHLDEELEARAYTYVVDPPVMQALIVSHLRGIWEKHLAPEWDRVKPILQDTVIACQQVDLGDKSRLEAARFITGQTLEEEKWAGVLDQAERVVFVPSAHVGPYLGKLYAGDALWVFFGPRLPEGVSFDAPDLSRAEILVRLNALADDSRLRILKLISEAGEQRSGDIMEQLELSQSAASRHLKQLSATGFLTERRCNGAKCYALNPDRIQNTLNAVSGFLLGS